MLRSRHGSALLAKLRVDILLALWRLWSMHTPTVAHMGCAVTVERDRSTR